jgi:hypothetical protein
MGATQVGKRGDKRRARKKEGRMRTAPVRPDPHVGVIVESLASAGALLREVTRATDPVAEVEERIASVVKELSGALVGIEPAGTIEVIRMMFLPWSHSAMTEHAGAEVGASITEVLALAFLGSMAGSNPEVLRPVDQDVCGLISETLSARAHEFLTLTSIRDMLIADSAQSIDRIAFDVKATGKLMRSTSYADMQADTLRRLFGHADVRGLVEQELGFSAENAILFLETCHEMQIELLNRRGRGIADAWNAITPDARQAPSEQQKSLMRDAFTDLFNPSADLSAISLSDLATRVGIDDSLAGLLANFFLIDLAPGAAPLLARLADGDSPFRASPLIVLSDRVMLLHPAQIQDAIKDSFEAALVSTGSWDAYQQHRGKYLERCIQALMARVLPGANAYDGFKYFIPKDEAEAAGDPSAYTKLVEGDHLFVLDDVAVIVEDKAIPLSARSRTGEVEPLRKNLARSITKGAEQAGRLKERIVADQGLRLRDGSWLDLSAIREIHTVVTSLDDLSGVSTATALLVQAGLLASDNIPWTVSLHDLDLITQLVDRPAEFLLYLRRRTDPLTTVMFTAVDELDLFLAFFGGGLYVEPDPERVARELPWVGTAKPGEIRRYKKQTPTLITSHTDALDAWHFSLHPPKGISAGDVAPKPKMVTPPAGELIDLLQSRGAFGWFSAGATLLDASTKAQRQLAEAGPELVSLTRTDQRPHSIAVPVGSSLPKSWLFVWASRPPAMPASNAKARTEAYLVAKREQYRLPRGVAFLYDGATGELLSMSYDAGRLSVAEDLLAEARADLRDVSDVDTRAQVTGKLRGR